MEKKEIFRIFDACEPTIVQVKEYLERISGNSPFDLVFMKDGNEVITRCIKKDMGELLGIVIGHMVFYAKGLGREEGKALSQDEITIADVFAYGKKKFHPKAFPMNRDALEILCRNRMEYAKLLDMLSVFGYKALPLQNGYLPINDSKNSQQTFADYCDIFGDDDGGSDIKNFIYFSNIFFCSSIK